MLKWKFIADSLPTLEYISAMSISENAVENV